MVAPLPLQALTEFFISIVAGWKSEQNFNLYLFSFFFIIIIDNLQMFSVVLVIFC